MNIFEEFEYELTAARLSGHLVRLTKEGMDSRQGILAMSVNYSAFVGDADRYVFYTDIASIISKIQEYRNNNIKFNLVVSSNWLREKMKWT